MNDLDVEEIEAQRVRDLQDRFRVEHLALLNWGAYHRDLRGIYPSIARTHVFDQFVHDGTEAYGEIEKDTVVVPAEAKAERGDEETYDEKAALALCERIHGRGGLPDYLRYCIRTAYVNGGPRESRWYIFADCSTPDQFLERLQASLQFVSRFA